MKWTREKIEARRTRALAELEICSELMLHVDDPPPPPKASAIGKRATDRALNAAAMRDEGLTLATIGERLGVTRTRAAQIVDRGYRLRNREPTPFDELPGSARNLAFRFLRNRGLEVTLENVLSMPLEEFSTFGGVGPGTVATIEQFISSHQSVVQSS